MGDCNTYISCDKQTVVFRYLERGEANGTRKTRGKNCYVHSDGRRLETVWFSKEKETAGFCDSG